MIDESSNEVINSKTYFERVLEGGYARKYGRKAKVVSQLVFSNDGYKLVSYIDGEEDIEDMNIEDMNLISDRTESLSFDLISPYQPEDTQVEIILQSSYTIVISSKK